MKMKSKKLSNAINIIQIILLSLIAIFLVIWIFVKHDKEMQKNVAIFVFEERQKESFEEFMIDGILQAAIDFNQNYGTNVKVNVIQFKNDEENYKKLLDICKSNKYDVVFASGKESAKNVIEFSENFPLQKFIIFDEFIENKQNIASIQFNHFEKTSFSEMNIEKKVPYETMTDFLSEKIVFGTARVR